MYYFSKNYFNLFKISLLVFTFLFILFFLFGIFFPHEAFAMEPPSKYIVEDYYGHKEYVGPDPYGYYHNPFKSNTTSAVVVNSDIIKPYQNDSYGKSSPYEED